MSKKAGWQKILWCVAEAVVAKGVRGACELIPGGQFLAYGIDVATDAYDRWKKDSHDAEMRQQIQQMAQAEMGEIRAAAVEVAREAAAGQPAAVVQELQIFLELTPAAARRSLQRPSDPDGKTVPSGMAIAKPDDLLALLPNHLPRYKPGDRPTPGGNYVLTELLGVGGFGEVWKASNDSMKGMTAAIKFCLHPGAAASLRNEADLIDRVMQQTEHPGILVPRDAFLKTDPPCLIYPYIPGGTMCGLAADLARLSPDKRLPQTTGLIRRLAEIVGHAHQLNPPIVHRDLKPANVLVLRKPDGKIDLRVTDFGIGGVAARQALEAVGAGRTSVSQRMATSLRGTCTALYAPEEQKRGEAPDPRDDVYALGIIWFQLLRQDLSAGLAGDWDADVRDVGAGEDVIALMRRCLAGKARRLANAGQLAEALADLTRQAKRPAEAKPVPVAPPPAAPVPVVVRPVQPPTPVKPAPVPVAEEVIPLAEEVRVDEQTLRDFRAHQAALLRVRMESWLEDVAPGRIAAWRRAAADDGVPEAQFLLGECTLSGIGTRKDPDRAFALYQSAARSGNAAAMNAVGFCYQQGKGTRQDDVQAVNWYRRAAEKNHPAGQHNLGCTYLDGKGVRADGARAAEWFRRAADQGLIQSWLELGRLYQRGFGVPCDHAQAAEYLRRAADEGLALAQGELGMAYLAGSGVQQDDRRAFDLLRRSAEQGVATAQTAVGMLHEQGRGTPMNLNQAAFWYGKAADQGDPDGCNQLGQLYQSGRGVPVDYRRARDLYRQAADQGHAAGQCNLGIMFSLGQGVPQDNYRAVEWYERSARQGFAVAEYLLGRSYLSGFGVPTDPVRGMTLLRSAASKGDQQAQALLMQLQAQQAFNPYGGSW